MVGANKAVVRKGLVVRSRVVIRIGAVVRKDYLGYEYLGFQSLSQRETLLWKVIQVVKRLGRSSNDRDACSFVLC